MYAHTSVQVTFEKSGRLSMDFAIETVDLSIYDDSFDLQRFLLEIYFTALCLYELFGEVVEMRAYIKRHNVPYLTSHHHTHDIIHMTSYT